MASRRRCNFSEVHISRAKRGNGVAWFSRAMRSYSCLRRVMLSEVTVTCGGSEGAVGGGGARSWAQGRHRGWWSGALGRRACLVRLVRGLSVHNRVHLAQKDLVLPLDGQIPLRLHLARGATRVIILRGWLRPRAPKRRRGGPTCMRFALYCTCGYCFGDVMSIPGFILRSLSTCISWLFCSSRSAVALLLTRMCCVDVGSG